MVRLKNGGYFAVSEQTKTLGFWPLFYLCSSEKSPKNGPFGKQPDFFFLLVFSSFGYNITPPYGRRNGLLFIIIVGDNM